MSSLGRPIPSRYPFTFRHPLVRRQCLVHGRALSFSALASLAAKQEYLVEDALNGRLARFALDWQCG